jgi:hypothetical protein
MKDLIALARLRALLLELGYAMRPSGADGEMDLLEAWMVRRCDDLDGKMPMELLLTGEEADRLRVADALKATIAREQGE